ncbi:MAG: beta-ketoacyl-ACP synthase III [Opitutus sp.]|nr:beta-ketoacyl-ACP synthase III [Opitutus sp.]
MGAYLPERVVTNEELGRSLGVTDEWIVERCGIRERRFAAQGEGTAAMAAKAVRRAVDDAGWKLEDIEFILFATLSPDHFFPGSGVYLQNILGLAHIGVMDVRNQCTGFLYSLVTANAFIASGLYRRIVVVGAEIHSHCLDVPETNKEVAVLFGDGAAAVALEVGVDALILASSLHVDGSGADCLKLELFDQKRRPWITAEDIQNRRHIPVMDGMRVFIRAVSEMTATAKAVVEKAGKKLEEVDLIVPHQANLRINETVRRRLGLPPERFFNNIQTRGNTTAASIPLAMVEARDAGLLKRGQLVLLVAFGSGFTWGGVLIRF